MMSFEQHCFTGIVANEMFDLCLYVWVYLCVYPLNPYAWLDDIVIQLYSATAIAHEIFPFYYIYYPLHAILILFFIKYTQTNSYALCRTYKKKEAISF